MLTQFPPRFSLPASFGSSSLTDKLNPNSVSTSRHSWLNSRLSCGLVGNNPGLVEALDRLEYPFITLRCRAGQGVN